MAVISDPIPEPLSEATLDAAARHVIQILLRRQFIEDMELLEADPLRGPDWSSRRAWLVNRYKALGLSDVGLLGK